MTVASIKNKPDDHTIDPRTSDPVELTRPLSDVFYDLETWRNIVVRTAFANQISCGQYDTLDGIQQRLRGDIERMGIG
jgi:hypothetical protein